MALPEAQPELHDVGGFHPRAFINSDLHAGENDPGPGATDAERG